MTLEMLDQIKLAQHKLIAKKLVPCVRYIRSAAVAIFASGKEPQEERIRCDT
jgi:hypothetical protein